MKTCIIIGGGILGATTAYKLAKRGVQVTVIDQEYQGQATPAAAGIICPWLSQRRNKAWYHLAKEGARIYPHLIQELNEDGEKDTGYSRVGALMLHDNHEKLLKTYQRGLNRLESAPEMGELTILDQKQTSEMSSIVNPEYESLHISGAARIDGESIRDALISGAQKYGAEFKLGRAAILYESNYIKGVSFNDKKIKADAVIVTSGAWMKETFRPLGINFKARPQKGQILHLGLQHTNTSKWPVLIPPNNLSIVPLNDRIMVGATHENKTGFDQQNTAGGIHNILSKMMEAAPGLAGGTLVETRVGFRPFTPDSLPIIGAIPGFKHLYAANGLGASGLTTGPYLGIQLAKLVLNEELDINLANYDINNAMEDIN